MHLVMERLDAALASDRVALDAGVRVAAR
jgi:hypothetical protein